MARNIRSPLQYGRSFWLRLTMGITFLLLYAPIVTLIVFSFNDTKRGVVWRGFTLKNYYKAWNDPTLFEALTNSLLIAGACTIVATILGTMVAVFLWRHRFVGKSVYEGFVALPIVVPEICMGVAMLVFFARYSPFGNLPWPLNLSAITVAHIAFAFPFVAIVVRSRLAGFNHELEEASLDLGASHWQTFWHILLPYMRPGIIAGALLAFTLSLDDFVITFFTAAPETTTFPVKVYSMVRRGVSPDINAASTVLILITIIATVIAVRLQAPDKSMDVTQ